jgi:hypothetical protein
MVVVLCPNLSKASQNAIMAMYIYDHRADNG